MAIDPIDLPPSNSSPPPSSSGTTAAPGGSAMSQSIGSPLAGTGDIPVARATADRAVNGPGRFIHADEIVEVSPFPTNTQNCFVSTQGPEQAQLGGPRRILAPTAQPFRVSVRNLADIWVYSAVVGEGILVSIRRG